jgi:HSP20 family protein
MTDEALKTCNEEACEPTVTARVDVFERDDEYLVHTDMPGVEAKDVDIRFENGELTIHGRRSAPKSGYHRSFRIGDQIASDRIDANLSNGVLTLKLPKVEAVKPRRIPVKC